MSAAFEKIEAGSALDVDPDRLPLNDRACLRLLARAGAGTSRELAGYVYTGIRHTQRRLHRLYVSGLLERASLVDTPPGRAEYAYRIGPLGHQRLRTGLAPAPQAFLRHTLDANDAVAALNRTEDRQHPPVQLWLTDTMSSDIVSRFVRPDSIVLVTTDAGSAVLALEIDEGTEHRRPIRAKLAAYRRPLAARPNWHLIVVVPSPIRADWMIRQAESLDLGPQAWVVTRGDLARDSLDAMLDPLDAQESPRSIRSLLKPPLRRTPAPVGSRAWIELLAAGGGEADDEALAP
jgi:Replication-relaxation